MTKFESKFTVILIKWKLGKVFDIIFFKGSPKRLFEPQSVLEHIIFYILPFLIGKALKYFVFIVKTTWTVEF